MNKNFKGIFIDSNIFVSYSKKDNNHNECKKFIDKIVKDFSKKKNLRFFVSRFSGVETASALRRKKSRKDAEAFLFKKESAWENIFIPIPPNPKEKFKIGDFIKELIEIALKFGTDFSDTLQTHSIETYKDQIDIVVTEDKDFKNRLQKRYKRIKIYLLKDDIYKILSNLNKNEN
ncbi:PIN domain-containing protein [Candidatus Pacearchaeota archaeon]|nr:PIN domain-containing protein [Candidatus Pacearchaeota archaeon]